VQIETGYGPASVELDRPARRARARFVMALTHGAGGGADSSDLLAARDAAVAAGGAVARVLQPYRVRGARAPGSPDRQDAAWLEIVAALRKQFRGLPLIQGGRSNGARVACRTAGRAGARGVLALAFPLHPPGKPERSRAAELAVPASVSVLVINGSRDPFGIPDPATARKVVIATGQTHALSGCAGLITEEVRAWLADVLVTSGR
jgi:predicted alpha/beta-hydrolase family hydrolase